jgi:DNA-binding response OmpR family regulator
MGGMTILVVEDEPAIREVEVAYLARAGHATIEVADGQAALHAFREHKPDLVLLDLSLPGTGGFEVCRVLRESSTRPILIVTARRGDEDEVRGLALGADDYIKKPFNPTVLVARVQTLLRRHGTKVLRFDGLTIDPQTMTVTKGTESIRLTTTRFNLLLALASHPEVVLSREQLMERMYRDPASHHVYDRTIDAHVKELRKQLEDDPRRPRLIETVVGAGYRFRRP